eukprot:m.15218 g.15218  ORF g.15218 m.15218 type:complete len:1014 (+) comp10489_c0_seq1:130-3171(+)
MSSWLKARVKEKVAAVAQKKAEQQVEIPVSSGFTCALCADLDLGSLDALQEHYATAHSEETDEPPLLDEATNKSNAANSSTTDVATNEEIETLRKNLKEEKWYTDALKKDIAELKTANEKLSENLKLAEKSTNVAEVPSANPEEVADAAAEKKALKESEAHALAKCAELQEKYNAIEADLQVFKAKTSESALTITTLSEKLELSERHITSLDLKYAESEQQLAAKRTEASNLATQLVQRPHPEDLQTLQDEITALRAAPPPTLVTPTSNTDTNDVNTNATTTVTATPTTVATPVCAEEDVARVINGDDKNAAADNELQLKLTAAQDSVTRVELENSSLTKQTNTLQRRLDDLQQLLTMKTDEHSSVTTAKAQLSERVAALEKQIQDNELALTQSKQAHSTAVSDVEKERLVSKDLQTKLDELTSLKEELATATNTIAEKSEQVENLRRKGATKDGEVKEAESRVTAMKLEVEKIKAEQSGLMERLSKSEADHSRLQREAIIKQAELTEAAAASTDLNTEFGRLQDKCSKKSKEALELRDKIVEYKDLLEGVKAEKNELKERFKEEGRLATEVATKVKGYKDETLKLEQAVTSAVEQLSQLSFTHEQAMKDAMVTRDQEVEQLNKRNAALERDLEAVAGDIVEMQQRTGSSDSELKRLQTALEAAEAKVADGSESLQQIKLTLEARCDELEMANSELVKSNTDMQMVHETLKKDLENSLNNTKELEEDKIMLEIDMGEVAKKFRQSQKDAKMLNAMIDQTKQLFVKQKLELQGQLTMTKELLEKAQGELRVSEAERETLKARSSAEVGNLRKQSELMEKQKDGVQRNLDTMKLELNSELQMLQSNLMSTQEQLDTVNATCAKQRQQMESLTMEQRLATESLADLMGEKKVLVDKCVDLEKKHKKLALKFNSLNENLKTRTSALQEIAEENQELQKTLNEMGSRQWQSSKGVKGCQKCDNKFTVTNRKHHCRNCGKIYCNPCSDFSAKTTTSKSKVRVCQECYTDLSSMKPSQGR